MLKLNPSPTFKTKVGIPVPGAEAVKVEFEFKALKRKELGQFLTDSKDREDAINLGAVVVGWTGVDKEFSQEALALLLDNYVGSAAAIFAQFLDELTARRQGN